MSGIGTNGKKFGLTLNNLVNNSVSGFLVHVVDHNVGAESCVQVGVCATEATSRAGDNGSLAIEADFR